MTTPRRRPRLRLWVVSLAIFAGGVVGRLIFTANRGDSLIDPFSLHFQQCAYGAALLVWVVWIFTEAYQGRRVLPGGLLAVVAFFLLITAVPK